MLRFIVYNKILLLLSILYNVNSSNNNINNDNIDIYGLNCSEKKIEQRDIMYWVANPSNLINQKTNSCSNEFLVNLSKYNNVMDSIGPYLWKSAVLNSTNAEVVYESNTGVKCYSEMRSEYPNIRIAASGGISECWNNNCR